jgi:hypothetical protein
MGPTGRDERGLVVPGADLHDRTDAVGLSLARGVAERAGVAFVDLAMVFRTIGTR